jgi:DNA polymerase-3 subunit delta'
MATDAFAEIRGQDEAVDVLRRAVAGGRVAHAYAFVGPAGSGRKATALAFARARVSPGDPWRAGGIDRGTCPDVRLIAPTPPEKNPKGPLALRIEDIREIERLAALRPAEAAWKVFIVDDADRMTGPAPEAILKTLEEPPAHTVIVLVLSRLGALPATVLSRCQILRFRPRAVEGARALLSDGRSEPYAAALSALAESRAGGADAILRVGEALGRDRSAAETLVEACWLHYRDLLCRERRRLAIGRVRDAARTDHARARRAARDSGPAGRRGWRSRAMSPRA